jgi:hypothetical protein
VRGPGGGGVSIRGSPTRPIAGPHSGRQLPHPKAARNDGKEAKRKAGLNGRTGVVRCRIARWMYATDWTVANADQPLRLDPGFKLER